MAKITDKERVLNVLRRNGGGMTTAAIANKAGVLHPSTRRYLNELRVEGLVTRGATHGTWVVTEQPEPVEVVDTDTVVLTEGEPVPTELDVNARSWYRLSCEGDVAYAQAVDESDAFDQLRAATDEELPRSLVNIELLPEGFELPAGAGVLRDGLMVDADEQTGDEPLSQMEAESDDVAKEEIQ